MTLKTPTESQSFFKAVKNHPYIGSVFWLMDPVLEERDFYGLPLISSDATIPLLPVVLADKIIPSMTMINVPEGRNFDKMYPVQFLLQKDDFFVNKIQLVPACSNYSCDSNHAPGTKCYGQETKKEDINVIKFRLSARDKSLGLVNVGFMSKKFTVLFVDARLIEVIENFSYFYLTILKNFQS